jgi:O-antigen/teichoic acid export membrane protein
MLLCIILPVVAFGGGYIQAIIGFVAASFLSFLLALYFKYLPVKNAGNEKCKLTYSEMFKFALPLLFSSIWGILIASTDGFFISRYFGTKIFAEFSNGSSELPFVWMVTGACATVLTPVFSKLSHESLDHKKEIFPIWKSVFEKSAKLIYPLLLYCWFFADILMIVLYGSAYENSAIYFRIKSLVNFFTIIVYAPLLIAIGKSKNYANIYMYSFFILVIAEYASILLINSPYAITAIFAICKTGRIFACLLLIAKYFDTKIYKLFPIKLLLKIVIPSALLLYLLRFVLIDCFSLNNVIALITGFVAYLIFYYLYCVFMKIDYLLLVRFMIKKE